MNHPISIVPLINAAGQTLIIVCLHEGQLERMQANDTPIINIGGMLHKLGIAEINLSFELVLCYEPDPDRFTEEMIKRSGNAKLVMEYVTRGWTDKPGDKRPDLFISAKDFNRGGMPN